MSRLRPPGSRNKLFSHLKQKCAPAVDRARARTERLVVAVGYVGGAFHGSYTSGGEAEAARPSLEGWVLSAARRAWGGGGAAAAAGEAPAAAGEAIAVGGEAEVAPEEAVEGVWGLLRTEKGAHAAENLLLLTVRSGLAAPEAALRAALAPHARLLAPPHRLAPAAVERLRGGVKRQTYAYALPYAELLSAAERRALVDGRGDSGAADAGGANAEGANAERGEQAGVGGEEAAEVAEVAEAAEAAEAAAGVFHPRARTAAEAEAEACGVWLTNAPHGCWTAPDLTPTVAARGAEGVRELLAAFGFEARAVLVPDCGGFVEATLAGPAEARACVAALHGHEWRGKALVAVALREARVKMAARQMVEKKATAQERSHEPERS